MNGALDLSGDVERLFIDKMKDFLDWAELEWAVTDKDRQDEAFRNLSDDRFEGYNDGIKSMKDALGVWLEDFPL